MPKPQALQQSNPLAISVSAANSPYEINIPFDLRFSGYQYNLNTSNGPVTINFDLANGTEINFLVTGAGSNINFISPSDIYGLGLATFPGQKLVMVNPIVGDFVTFTYNSGGANVVTQASGNFQVQ